MKWAELEEIIKDTVINIRFVRFGSLGHSEGVKVAAKNVKTLCDYMFEDGKIDIDKDICFIYNCAKELHTNTISYINSNDDIKRVLYEDSKVELDKEPASLKELAGELVKIEYGAKEISDTINQYFKRSGKTLEPQHKAPEALQQPPEGAGGQLADNGNETRPEPTAKPIVKEQLPTIYDDEVNKAREQYVFYKAIKGGWMELKGSTYEWKRNQFYLALMCGLLYWGDKVTDDLGANTNSLAEYPKILLKSIHRFKYKSGDTIKTKKDIEALFGGANVSNLRSQLIELSQVEEYDSIVRLFPTQTKTG